ncbi:hypothetical protein QVD17_34660 [Tagetes erecta]|uniref:Secreted protein n=1 Tax=Tagetes erecta TaxID=13708 RepID=A0AAD8JZP3_TARER|nr:hypothetical protein QVD17_34660 [Tagetes erecta]
MLITSFGSIIIIVTSSSPCCSIILQSINGGRWTFTSFKLCHNPPPQTAMAPTTTTTIIFQICISIHSK